MADVVLWMVVGEERGKGQRTKGEKGKRGNGEKGKRLGFRISGYGLQTRRDSAAKRGVFDLRIFDSCV